MTLKDINLKIILDSRGKETLEAEMESGEFFTKASVPAGKSTGTHEAFVLEPKKALEKFQEIKPQILSASASERISNQKDFDEFLISLDGTPSASSEQAKQNLGGNLILSLSLAFARLKAKSENLELFQFIRNNFQFPISNFQSPHPIFNVINGGAHSSFPRESALSLRQSAFVEFQEFQVIPQVNDFNMAFSIGKIFYRKLGDILRQKFGSENIVLGDEAGYSAPFRNNEEALEVMAELIEKNKYPLKIGLDVAASQFYHNTEQRGLNADKRGNNGYYIIGGKKYYSEELRDYYLKLIDAYDIISIEDPFCEEAFDDFSNLTSVFHHVHDREYNEMDKKLVITDDLTTTNPERLKIAIEKKSGNAILIKLNQIGTLTETLEVVKMAYENNWQAVVSHRSGETMDDFIADLAAGINAWGIKAGAPAKPERLAKYDRLSEICKKLTH